MATINEGLTQLTAELKDTNLRYSKATEAYQALLPTQMAQNAVLSGIGGSIKENLVQSTSGFKSFIDQLEALPVFGAISGIAKTLGGKLFSAVRQRNEDKRIAKQLGITKEEVAIRRKEQEMLKSQEENNKKLLDVAAALGYSTDEFEKMTGAKQQGEMTAAEVEKAREDRRANERLVAAVEGVGDGINNLEISDDEESKGFFSGILDSVKGFIPAIGAALVSLGTTVLGGLVALGTKIVLALKGGLGGVGKLLKKLPGGRALGNIFKKSLGGIAKLGTAGAGLLSTGASAAGAGVKAAGGMAGTALKGIGKAAKFIPGAGLAVTAGMALFDGLTAGFKEYSESGSFVGALKEGTAGALSGITFGLVSQETISNGMSAIGDFAKKGWDGFTNLASGAMEGLSNIGSSVGGWFSSWWSDEEEGIKDENQNASGIIGSVTDSVKATASSIVDTVGGTLTSAAEGFNNLTGLNVPTNLTELKDGLTSTFDNISAGFENLTGIEVPTFDELSEKVSGFANNMKENIAKGWESVTDMASNAWGGVKSFFGFGGDDEKVEPNKEKLEKLNDQKMLNDMEMEEISKRMDKMESRGGPKTRSQRKQYEKDQARFDELIKEDDALDREITKLTPPTYPTELQYGYVSTSPEKVFFTYKPNGEIVIEPNQLKASEQYFGVKPVEKPQQGTILERSNSVAAQISRDYMKNGGNTTVVNAPNNSTTVAGGGGGSVPMPVPMRDNSSASQAAASHNF